MLDLLKSTLRLNMIKSLYIKNYILIDALEIDFSDGFTVFTGETGAGKSIIVGALSLLLGERADTKVIGPFSDQAEIIASFDVSNNNEALYWLEENELGNNNDDELQLRRTLNNEGRSRLWINGRPSNASMVRQLGQSLVQIHGQHDQVRLLKSQEQLKILDASASYTELLQKTQQAAASWHDLNKQLQELYEAGSLSNEQSQLLEYQYEELENLNLSATEYEQLHQDLQTATHAVDLELSISQALDTLKTNDNSC
ncbi:MAG: AAA family ATPase [Proteobacteria bacterium]|nr:AAA family ATPase [Pseudomonadota bacterium]